MLKYADPPGDVFHALGDPTRRDIVERLSRGPATVSELAAPLPMSLPAVVQHLHVLQECGLIESEKVGRVRTCRVRPATMRRAEVWIAERRAEWERSLDRLGEYLADEKEPAPGSQRRASQPSQERQT